MYWLRKPRKKKIVIQSKKWGKGWLLRHPGAATSEARLKQSEYLFIAKGNFKQETYIHDKYTKELLGLITFNSLRTRADIRLVDNKLYRFRYVLPWMTAWNITYNQRIMVAFQSRWNKGVIEAKTDEEVLVLTGLYIRNFYLLYFIGGLVLLSIILTILF